MPHPRHLASLLVLLALPAGAQDTPLPTPDEIASAARLNDLTLEPEELEALLEPVFQQMSGFARLRGIPLDNGVPTALVFEPLGVGVERRAVSLDGPGFELALPERPDDLEELAFADIATLAALIKSRQVSCVELATMHLERLKRLDGELFFVVNLTEERALLQAAALDAELEAGTWRGPLHGIPWGAKDLLAVADYPTTWGAKPYADQVIDLDAAVVERLDAAGAVLVAKLTLGALAMGDVWFGGTTRNPWNPEQGSSGSSAGPGSATAAGAVAFSIGSETLGSIVSPSVRCGNSSIRPTFGLVSRHGAMALSWSMDKLGPMCRSVADAGIVLEAIAGVDPRDAHSADEPYRYAGRVSVEGLRVGYPRTWFERSEELMPVLDQLRELGVELVEVEYPDYPVRDLLTILMVEAATAFDEITRDGRDDELVRQTPDAWPSSFRSAQLVPAVEYVRANRVRAALMGEMDDVMATVDAVVHPPYYGLTTTNLTGHPTIVAPAGFSEDGTPFSVGFTGQLYDDARLVALAQAWQESTEHHLRRPELAGESPADSGQGAGR